jgi:hypothetical protein
MRIFILPHTWDSLLLFSLRAVQEVAIARKLARQHSHPRLPTPPCRSQHVMCRKISGTSQHWTLAVFLTSLCTTSTAGIRTRRRPPIPCIPSSIPCPQLSHLVLQLCHPRRQCCHGRGVGWALWAGWALRASCAVWALRASLATWATRAGWAGFATWALLASCAWWAGRAGWAGCATWALLASCAWWAGRAGLETWARRAGWALVAATWATRPHFVMWAVRASWPLCVVQAGPALWALRACLTWWALQAGGRVGRLGRLCLVDRDNSMRAGWCLM